MKTGFTPREQAHAIAVDALYQAYRETLDDSSLPAAKAAALRQQIERLHGRLADAARLDVTPLDRIVD